MTIKRKAEKTAENVASNIEEVIGRIIERGGEIGGEKLVETPKEIRFTLRMGEEMIKKIDAARKSRVGTVSRNQWVVEAIAERLNGSD
jgi:hypothetical protein